MNRTNQNRKGQAPAEGCGRRGFFLVGPTASGKSAVAQLAAEGGGSAILSADSMLVYRGMDIGTDKPGAEQRRRVRHYGIDLADPDECFSVGLYLRCVEQELRSCDAGLKQPLIAAGGTGLYINALLYGLEPLPPGDPERRAYWAARLKEVGAAGLREELRRLAPALLEGLEDKDNPRRLVRALELAEAGFDRPPSGWRARKKKPVLAGLRRSPEDLNERIERRAEAMFRGGLLDEVAGLLERYGSLAATARRAIGYAEAIDLLSGRCGESEAIERTALRTRRLAKRQRTWFAHQTDVEWVDIAKGMDDNAVADAVAALWGEHGASELSV